METDGQRQRGRLPSPLRTASLRSALVASLALASLAVTSPAASAADGGWVRETIVGAAEPGPLKAFLNGVACSTPSTCLTVGTGYDSSDASYGLADVWAGSQWLELTELTSEGEEGGLTSLSCTPEASCVAVGEDTQGALTAIWDGSSWQTTNTPSPIMARGISCVSTSMCVAVGFGGHEAPAAEIWNGSGWTRLATPRLRGTGELAGVSCTSATACTAVGFSIVGPAIEPLIETWNGQSWRLVAHRNTYRHRFARQAGELLGVSCTSPGACTAVGFTGPPEDDVSDYQPVVARPHGTHWDIGPAAGHGFLLQGVSCTAATTCTAVGGGASAGGSARIETSSGSHWYVQPNPASGKPTSALTSVSCTAATVCTAVGSVGLTGRAIVERESSAGTPPPLA